MSIVVRALCATLLLLVTTSASARMYQWVDPRSGTAQLSGSPPAWYRGTQAGPRVFVFENGRLVDDTARAVEPAQAAALRDEAFGNTAPAAATLSPHSPLRAPMFEAPAQAPAAAAPSAEEDSTSAQIAEFKALLETYDQTQAAAAHEALDEARAAHTPLEAGAPSAPSP